MMTQEEFAGLLNCTQEQVNEIATALGGDAQKAEPHDSQFKIHCNRQTRRGLILKISGQARKAYFSFYTYSPDGDYREGLRRHLNEQRMISTEGVEFDGLRGVEARNRANTRNGTVCDFYPITAIPPNAVLQNLDNLKRMKGFLIDRLYRANAFTVAVQSSAVVQGENQVMTNVTQSDVTAEEISSMKVHLRPIPVGVAYPEGVIDPCKISGVVSWVTSIDALFNRDAITLSDGRIMRPGQYIIPPYQRKYAWSYDNVSRLCRDLIKAKDAGKETYHLGTVILHHQEGDEGDSFYVVDGQQRLTTISYLINCEIFATGVSSPKIKNSDIKNILSALEEYREEKDCILEQLKRCTLVVIAVSDINEAFQLFSTQNGRGRPLTPANLLKAYHLHELDKSVDAAEKDRVWESNNAEKTVRDGRLLSQVLGEHLYRLRCWCRGEFPKEQFSNSDIKEFKGITFNDGSEEGVPAQNLMRLRQRALVGGSFTGYYSRLSNDKMYALATIDQPIINGADFFKYVESYAEAHRVLFGSYTAEEVAGFRKFYEENCNYRRSDRRGDTYARHVFESLCLFCYDRFGASGLDACKSHLYRCAYYERAVKFRCYYCTCGATFAVPAVRVMSACMTLADVKDRLHALSGAVLESFRNEKRVFSSKPTPEGVDCVRRVYEN